MGHQQIEHGPDEGEAAGLAGEPAQDLGAASGHLHSSSTGAAGRVLSVPVATEVEIVMVVAQLLVAAVVAVLNPRGT